MGSSARRGLVIVSGGVAGLALALVHAACGSNVFACSSSDECSDGGTAGTCEPSGFCSFPDDECESGARYGDHAGDSLAGDCVPTDAGTTGDTADDSASTNNGNETLVLEDSGSDDVDPTTVDPTTVDESTTDLPLPNCGDGTLDPDEACDDDNTIDGDGCNADCVVSGTLIWEIIEDGGMGMRDGAGALAIDGADAIYVAAWFTSGQSPQPAVRRLTLDGAIVWTTAISGPMPWDSVLTWGIELDEVGNPAVAASATLDAGNEWVVAQLDSDGEILWQSIEPGQAFGLDVGENVWVCGRGATGEGMLIGYDAMGNDQARLEGEPYHPANGFAWDIVVDTGELVISGSIDAVPERGFLRRVAPSGTVFESIELDPSYDEALALALGSDAWWFVGRSNVQEAGWIAATTNTLTDLAGPTIVTEAGSPANLHGVTIGPSGEVVVVGWQTVGAAYDALVQKYTSEGELLWSRTYATIDDLADSARDVVVASDGTIVFAGHAGPLNAAGDFWVAALAP